MTLLSHRPDCISLDDSGTARIRDSRLLFDLIANACFRGETGQTTHKDYPTLNPANYCACILYCATYPDEVIHYLAKRNTEAELIQKKLEAL